MLAWPISCGISKLYDLCSDMHAEGYVINVTLCKLLELSLTVFLHTQSSPDT